MLSKSRYLKGLKCHKALWLYHHKKDKAYYPESTQQIFAAGNATGELAQDYFPGGELALVDDFPNYKAAQKTEELIQQGYRTIYEATFIAHNTLIALDILHQIDGKWHAFEVKSTNSAKPEHIRDAAIQYYVMTQAGLEIEDISIMYFDKHYVRRGDIVPRKLFTYESVVDRINPYLVEIPQNIEIFLALFQKEEPTIQIGTHCDQPYGCEFQKYCNKLPENQDILNEVQNQPELGTEITYKNENAIQDFLVQNPYPIYSLDFETVMYGIPEFDESRPYQQIPFQFSLHVQKEKDSTPEHFEFLGNGIDDPREKLIITMLSHLGTKGSILVYSKSFEEYRIKELGRDFPQYKIQLNKVVERLVDLAVPYRKHIKTEATQKKWSLKIVQPTFLPHLSYNDLDIQHGMAAMDAYKLLAQQPEDEQKKLRQNMLDYCEIDTLAVLELYQHLYSI